MKAKALMIQGTGSHAGKSAITAALCRIFSDMKIKVAPFKAQNMALNSGVTKDGLEMGRAQIAQAEAAFLEPHVDMNPVLLKPTGESRSQLIIQGRVKGQVSSAEFQTFKKEAFAYVKESYERLASKYELIIIEGAGSPAEINLRENDIANMGTAHMADAKVLLVGDIDRGGVFASLIGTLELLDQKDKDRICAFIINKFRGDIELLKPALKTLEERSKLPVAGVVPFIQNLRLEEEDGVSLERVSERTSGQSLESLRENKNTIKAGVIHLPRISNHTDFSPLMIEDDLLVKYIREPHEISDLDLLIIPGSKNVIGDMIYLREAGFDKAIFEHKKAGKFIFGVCGGYQILGEKISDPHHVEAGSEIQGLGLLKMNTVLMPEKETRQVRFQFHDASNILNINGHTMRGYEIHAGKSGFEEDSDGGRLFQVESLTENGAVYYDGVVTAEGRLWGTYIHGIFDNDSFREAFLRFIRERKTPAKSASHIKKSVSYAEMKEAEFERLAKVVKENMNIDWLCEKLKL
ncbi:MAG: cobyric acid synthase [Spirochaetia bacterium]|nr:cobyric acid synthase [Spirochaetia bacterium]